MLPRRGLSFLPASFWFPLWRHSSRRGTKFGGRARLDSMQKVQRSVGPSTQGQKLLPVPP